MKTQKIFLLLALMVVFALFTSCAQLINNTAKSTPTPTSISNTKTPAPILTLTSNSTHTPVAIPMLSVEDARARLLELLANNGDCRLPCLWGITPGKSSYQEAQAILAPLSSISKLTSFKSESGTVSPLYAEGDLTLSTDAGFLSNNQIVSHLVFNAWEEKVAVDSNGNVISTTSIYGLPTFIKRVEYYSLAHLLSEQGLPTSVMVTSAAPSLHRLGSISTQIVVLYPNQGIWARYETAVNEDEVKNNIKSCPANAHVEMELYPVGNPDIFYGLLDQTDWGITKNAYKPLEEATSMSVEQFYETFRQPTDKCIETPVELWPKQ